MVFSRSPVEFDVSFHGVFFSQFVMLLELTRLVHFTPLLEVHALFRDQCERPSDIQFDIRRYSTSMEIRSAYSLSTTDVRRDAERYSPLRSSVVRTDNVFRS